jgi:hypothetical protein
VVLQALRHAPFAGCDFRAVDLEFRAALARDIGDGADRALEPRSGGMERVVALLGELVAVGVEACEQPSLLRRDFGAEPGELGVAAVQHLFAQLPLHRRGHVLRGA